MLGGHFSTLLSNDASLSPCSAGRREKALGWRLTPLRERFGGQKCVLAGGAELDKEVSRVFTGLARLNRGVSVSQNAVDFSPHSANPINPALFCTDNP